MAHDQEALAAAATRLYALVPGEFIAARGQAAKQAKADGDGELAAALGALRRPTVAAWAVNLLARSPGALDAIVALGTDLRAAQARLDTRAMRELGSRRSGVIAQTTAAATDLVTEADPSAGVSGAVREQIEATLTAAIADPGAQDAVTSGTLVTALSYAGFGEVEIGEAVAVPLRVVPAPAQDGDATRNGNPNDATSGPDNPEADADTDVAAEPDVPHEPDPAAVRAAEQTLEKARQRLEVAESAMAQARARRAQARRAVEQAQEELDRVQDGDA